MEPIVWGKGRQEAFRQRFRFELDRAINQRKTLDALWRSYLDQYRAPDGSAVGTTPIEGASRRTYPLTAMNVDPILARYLKTLHGAPNVWTCSPLNEKWVPVAKPLSDYLQWIDAQMLHMWDVNYRVLLETLKLGTGIYKTGWKYERHAGVRGYDSREQVAKMVRVINQPWVDQVHLANFFLPAESRSIDPDAQGGAPWVAERLRFRPEQLRGLATGQRPFAPNFNPEETAKVLNTFENSLTEYDQQINSLDQISDDISMAWRRPVELFEIHARFDTSGNGMEDDVVVLFHIPTMAMVRSTYETLGYRPYSAIRYLRGDGFYGIGLGEQTRMWQDVQSQLLNFNIDRMLLCNAPMIAVKEGANILPNEPIFPGKIWTLQNPKDDIQSLFLAGGNPGDILATMNTLAEGAKQRTGVTDLQFGSVGAIPSRTPATTIQSLLQEGNTRFDMSIQDIRFGGLGEVGLRVLQNLQYQISNVNNPDARAYLDLAIKVLGEKHGLYADSALNIPQEPVEQGIGVELTATSGSNNKELQKQSWLALMQIIGQRAPMIVQMAQIAMQAQGTPLSQIAVDLLRGEQEMMTRLLEQYDVRNPDELVPNIMSAFGAAQANAAGVPLSPLVGAGGGLGIANTPGVGAMAGAPYGM